VAVELSMGSLLAVKDFLFAILTARKTRINAIAEK
jgi:hypothetical protein